MDQSLKLSMADMKIKCNHHVLSDWEFFRVNQAETKNKTAYLHN